MSKDKGVKNIKKLAADKSITKTLSSYQAEKQNKSAITPLVIKKKL